jgi:hypothetical protein
MGLLSRISYFYRMLIVTSIYGEYQKYMSKLVKPYYEKLEWEEKESDSWIEKSVLRDDLIAFACFRGLPECLQKVKLKYDDFMQNEKNNT